MKNMSCWLVSIALGAILGGCAGPEEPAPAPPAGTPAVAKETPKATSKPAESPAPAKETAKPAATAGAAKSPEAAPAPMGDGVTTASQVSKNWSLVRPAAAFDKVTTSCWTPPMGYDKDWIMHDLGRPTVITGYSMLFDGEGNKRPYVSFDLEGSTDGEKWVTLDSREKEEYSPKTPASFSVKGDKPYRYYRLQLKDRECWFRLYEMDFETAGKSKKQ